MLACESATTCLYEYDLARSFPANDPRNWLPSPCLNCMEGIARKMNVTKPEPDPVAAAVRPDGTHRRGPMPLNACRRGHDRAIYGRKHLNGRDAGQYTCRECERINLANRLKKAKRFCVDCGKPVTMYAKQCQQCRCRDISSKKYKSRKVA